MNFLSLNIRGLRGGEKEAWVKDIKSKHGLNFLALQETKVGNTEGKIKGSGEELNVLNIYAPQGVSAKKVLWEAIEAEIGRSSGLGILLGDFNAVRSPDERRNSAFKAPCARNFNAFIHNMGFVEYNMTGKQFTCSRDNGKKLSKIDRLLVSHNFFSKWPTACLRALPWLFSDHCPLMLTTVENIFGPKPFRVFNSLIGKNGVEEVVKGATESFHDSGPADSVLSKKMAFIKDHIKKWRDDMLLKEREAEIKALEEIEILEEALEERERA
ncbi:uncharacterized protein LOC110906730 [Helianthus annuus]|uniref:uncharacterized protein LOC110906730 n=1 Tax=Helianthus annuus TaxID=4232 RepID=UPI000B8F4510|nr:uncharacterized protein LOC110906730 [Helianthus annuus]